MKALLLIAHGSRRAQSNEEVKQLLDKLKAKMSQDYPVMEACFLELAKPLIDEGLECCKQQGATEIYVVPYFLSAGRHVETDVPEEVNLWLENNQDIKVHQIPHVGASATMLDLINQSVSEYSHES